MAKKTNRPAQGRGFWETVQIIFTSGRLRLTQSNEYINPGTAGVFCALIAS